MTEWTVKYQCFIICTQHEQFNQGDGAYPNDIALIRLELDGHDISGNIITVADGSNSFVGETCVLSGWGITGLFNSFTTRTGKPNTLLLFLALKKSNMHIYEVVTVCVQHVYFSVNCSRKRDGCPISFNSINCSLLKLCFFLVSFDHSSLIYIT